MQGLAGLLFPVLLMVLALVMEKYERLMTTPRAPRSTTAPADDEGPTVETLASIGLPSAVEQLDLDRSAARELTRELHRHAS